MAELYGHAWVSQYGEKDSGTWYKSLRDMSVKEIADGLAKCLSRKEKKWPPGLVEFRDMCRPKKYAYHQTYKGLPSPEPNKELAEKTLKEMKNILKPDYLDDLSKGKI